MKPTCTKSQTAAAVLLILLAGCATTPSLVPVKTAIPVECREKMPDRPAMPTEALQPGATLDAVVQAAAAEIELREGYEGKLATALAICIKPLRTAE